MYKLKYLTLIMVSIINSGCNAAKLEIQPYFNSNNQSAAFFEKPLVVNSANGFLALQEKAWDYPSDLKHEKKGHTTVTNCLVLNNVLSEGYLAANAYDHAFVNTQSAICSMWAQMGKFKSYNVSFMDQLILNKNFATQVPAQFALSISNDDMKKALSAANWHEVSKIKEVKRTNAEEATYYDSSGSIQRLTLMAKGDYNADGIEDRLFFMENSVEGGSYSSSKVYIITRLTANGPITLLKEI
jgi:hypothetical protein